MTDLLIATLVQGLLWAVLAIGVFITFRMLDIPDLTVEGSFPLGAAVCAAFLVEGVSPLLAIFVAMVAGMFAGAVTGFLYTKMKIPALLSGILTMIGLYSVNLRIMGKANLSFLRVDTVYTWIDSLGFTEDTAPLVVGMIAVLAIVGWVYWFFGTELGVAIRATGCNPSMIRAQGVNTDLMILLGLMISNVFVALAGALIAQFNGFADVGMGVGTIVIGLASVIIGEVLFGTRSFANSLISIVLGSVVYRLVIAAVLYLGMPPNDLKLFTAILVALALVLPLWKRQFLSMRKEG